MHETGLSVGDAADVDVVLAALDHPQRLELLRIHLPQVLRELLFRNGDRPTLGRLLHDYGPTASPLGPRHGRAGRQSTQDGDHTGSHGAPPLGKSRRRTVPCIYTIGGRHPLGCPQPERQDIRARGHGHMLAAVEPMANTCRPDSTVCALAAEASSTAATHHRAMARCAELNSTGFDMPATVERAWWAGRYQDRARRPLKMTPRQDGDGAEPQSQA